jgi:hypothetical protein
MIMIHERMIRCKRATNILYEEIAKRINNQRHFPPLPTKASEAIAGGPHHVTAARPRHGRPVPERQRHQAPWPRRHGAVALPVLHVPPRPQRLNRPHVVQARDVVRRRHAPPHPAARLPPHAHRQLLVVPACPRRGDACVRLPVRLDSHGAAAVVRSRRAAATTGFRGGWLRCLRIRGGQRAGWLRVR